MFFKKKIIVTEEMKQTLQSFDEISWASCCGIPYKSVYSRNLASQCGKNSETYNGQSFMAE